MDLNKVFYTHLPSGLTVEDGPKEDALSMAYGNALATVADLKRQLAEAKAEIEADDRNVNNLMDQVHEMSQEIERLRAGLSVAKEETELLIAVLEYPEHTSAFENLHLKRELSKVKQEQVKYALSLGSRIKP